jgi:hypothetical protein
MGLKIRLYNIVSSNSYTVRYKSGTSAWPEYDNATFTLYNTGLTASTIEIDNLMFDTQYWFKIIDETSNRYIIKNINTHSSVAFPCYDLVPIPTSTPVTPTSTPVPPTSTPVPPTSTPVPPTSTPVPPTSTPVTPTSTPVTPTSTPVTPTSTPVTPTSTPVTPTSTPVTPTSTPLPPTPTINPPDCTCWSFENTGIGVANVSYDDCNSGPSSINIDFGSTIYKCVTYGTTPVQNSGTIDMTPSLVPCVNQSDCEPTPTSTPSS